MKGDGRSFRVFSGRFSDQVLRRAVAGLLLVGAAMAPSHAKDWKTVVIATEGAYAPYNLTRPDGTLDGFEPELAHELCRRMRVECRLIAQDWDGIIPGLQAGKFDAIMDGMSITAERRQVIDFSRPYASTPATFIASRSGPLANLPGSGQVIDLGRSQAAGAEAIAALRKALKGRTIGVQVATIHANFLDRYFKDVATIREYKTTDEQDLDLIAGRIDAALGDASYFIGTLAKPEGGDLVLTGAQFDGGEIFGDGVGIGLRKRDADLRALFDGAIEAAHNDGTLRRLSLKWFKLDTAPR